MKAQVQTKLAAHPGVLPDEVPAAGPRPAAFAAAAAAVLLLALALAAPPSDVLAQLFDGSPAVHFVLELGTVVAAALVVAVAWHGFDARQARAVNVIVGGFSVVACCDLAAALAFDGLVGASDAAPHRDLLFWFAARMAEILTLALVACGVLLPLSRRFWLVAGLAAAALLVFAGQAWPELAALFAGGHWAGSAVSYLEYALAAAMLVLAAVFRRRYRYQGRLRDRLLVLPCFLLGLSQLAFASDHAALDLNNLLGHAYKLAAYGLVYWALFASSIRLPYDLARESERRLRDSEARLRSLGDHLPNCVVYQMARGWDGTVRLTHVSESVEKMTGLRAEAVLANHRLLFDRVIEEDQPMLRSAIQHSAERMEVFDVVVRGRHLDGRQRWFRFRSAPRRLDDGGIAWDGVQIDITDEKLAEEEVRRSEALMRAMIDHIPLEIWVRDAQNGEVILENRASVQRFGVRLGLQMREQDMHRHDLQAGYEVYRRVLAGEMVEGELEYDIDGQRRTYYSLKVPIRSDGGVLGVVNLQMDLTERKRAEARLHAKEAELAAILLHLPGGVSRLDRELRFLFVNQQHADWFGRPAEEIVGRDLEEVVASPERFHRMLPYVQRTLQGEHVTFENRVEHPSGGTRYRLTSLVPERSPGGEVVGFVVFATDTTERKHTEIALAENQARLSALVRTIPDVVFLKDRDGVYLSCNPQCERFFGMPEAELIGKTDYDFGDLERAEHFRAQDRQVMDGGQQLVCEEWLTRGSDGYRGLFETIKTPLRDTDGAVTGVLGVSRDITARKRAEQEIERLAFYDSLTNLPNRRLLLDRLQHITASSHRSKTHGALLFIDLDNFKDLNDTLGHDKGDLLLQQVAQRLLACIRESDTVSRFGGDEFVVIVENLSLREHEAISEAGWVGEKILIALNQPYALNGAEHHSTPSVGIVLFQGQTVGVDELLKRADLAMYQAKAAGRNTLCFFDPHIQAAVTARSALEADLRQGLQRRELLLHYQRVVDEHGRITGAEALVRWMHPQRGMVSPAAFIPLAEQTGLILPLGEWVLHAACEQLVAWAGRPGLDALTLSVNVSARQFRHPEFVAQVLEVLRDTGAPAGRLKFELTESLLLSDVEDIIAKMSVLKAKGVGFSLDDFGTGYSSLSYLKRLPLDQLKIDQSFVRDVLTDPNDAAIAKTILTLAQSLDLEVVAEGVEDAGQLDFLRRNGCRAFQGYLFGRPAPVQALEAGFPGPPAAAP